MVVHHYVLFLDVARAQIRFRILGFAQRRTQARADLESFREFFAELMTEDGRRQKVEGFNRAYWAAVEPYGFTIAELRQMVMQSMVANLTDWIKQEGWGDEPEA